tara:strand:+ start:1 stop:876 length:876 start_codon:yes stop_codon:yes gene_type:complete
MLKFNISDIQKSWDESKESLFEGIGESSSLLSKGVIMEDEITSHIFHTSIKLLAAYCTPNMKKEIKQVSKTIKTQMKRRRNITKSKWIWGTNKITYIYPPSKTKNKHISEYYCRPSMAKYYIVNLEKYQDRPIYEDEEYDNPRYRYSVILSRAGSWKGNKEKLFYAGADKKNYSRNGVAWIKHMSKLTGNQIQHAENGKEFKITVNENHFYLADGYCKKTNTVYEFNGDYWHGNPAVYDADDINKTTKTTFGDLYKKTLEKEDTLKRMGFNVVSIWEKDWNEKRLTELNLI